MLARISPALVSITLSRCQVARETSAAQHRNASITQGSGLTPGMVILGPRRRPSHLIARTSDRLSAHGIAVALQNAMIVFKLSVI